MMIRKILIPTDGYGLEDHVIDYVGRVFPQAEFHIISVVNTYERGITLTDILYREMKQGAQNAIDEAEKRLKNMGISPVKKRIIEGLPSKKIVEYAKLHDMDLIAMRVYGRKSTASAYRMGSTVKNVLRRSYTPVLTLASPCHKTQIKRVLLLTDGTKKSKRAENFAILFASTYSEILKVVYLHTNEKDKHHSEKILHNVSWKAKFWEVDVEKKTVDSYDSLLGEINESDIVIMGVGKRSILGCKIGHLAQFVATHSPVPIIFVRRMKERWFSRGSGK